MDNLDGADEEEERKIIEQKVKLIGLMALVNRYCLLTPIEMAVQPEDDEDEEEGESELEEIQSKPQQ